MKLLSLTLLVVIMRSARILPGGESVKVNCSLQAEKSKDKKNYEVVIKCNDKTSKKVTCGLTDIVTVEYDQDKHTVASTKSESKSKS